MEEKLPLTVHLEELRTRVIRILAAVGSGFVGCYFFREALFRMMTQPLADVLPPGTAMVFTGLPEAFFVHVKIAFFASLFLTSPFTLYQVWRFVAPGLYPGEKRYVLPFVLSSSCLFIGGVLFGYFVALPPAFAFFVGFSTDFLKPMISFKEYVSFSLKMLLAFGLSFQMPVFLFFLGKLGVVNAAMLAQKRRYAILAIFVAAAILTPSPDAMSQILMALPLLVLYEVSIVLVKYANRGPAKEAAPREDSP